VTTADRAVVGLLLGRETVETWIGVDGSWRVRTIEPAAPSQSVDMVAGGDGLFPPQANATTSVNGVPTNMRDPGDGLFTYAQVRSLPIDVARLRARIERAVRAQAERNVDAYVLPGPRHRQQVARLRPGFLGHGQAGAALIAISDLYASPVPQPVRADLYKVAAGVPGVRTTAGVRDGSRRPGVALRGGELQLIFDPRTGALLSGTAGTVLAQGPVNAIDAVPPAVRPITTSAASQPPQLRVDPFTGTARTVFSASFHAPAGATASQPAPGLAANMFGPTGPGCVFWVSRPPIARIQAGAVSVRDGIVTYTYRVAPSVIGRPSWCPGRYQLMVSPIPSNHPLSQVRQAMQSHAAVYFNVR
jgi:hypothetical protein